MLENDFQKIAILVRTRTAMSQQIGLRPKWQKNLLAGQKFGCWATATGVMVKFNFHGEASETLERDCTEHDVCQNRDERDEDENIGNCGWKRLEEIWGGGQK